VHLYALLERDVAVLTASRRLAHAIRLGYARHSQQRGLSAWRTPHVLPWSAWLRQLHVDARASGSPRTTRSRVLTPTQVRILWDDIVASSRTARDLLNPSNAARLAARSWRRLHEYLIPLDSLKGFDAPEAQALYAWSREFEQRCAALDALDEARLAHWAYESELIPSECIALAGFDAMPPAMTRLLERWRAKERVVEIAPAERDAAGISVVAAEDASDLVGSPHATRRSAPRIRRCFRSDCAADVERHTADSGRRRSTSADVGVSDGRRRAARPAACGPRVHQYRCGTAAALAIHRRRSQ
jgi:hypothetical protein